MKRALTGIAAAAVVLGSVSPMAFAATTTSGLTKAGQLPIVVNGSVLSNPYEMTGKDSGNTTAFFPVYYFDQALAKVGFTATWDGTTHTWAITAPNVDASTISIAGGVGTGNTTITVNGVTVKKINTQAAKDPAASKSAGATTYLPAYYVDEILTAIGAQGTFSGQTGLKITGNATNSNTPSLGAITVSGQSLGSGTTASPAVVTNSGNVTTSTTLTDANGNPVAGINVTFNVWGSTNLPNVTSNGLSVSNTGSTGADSTHQAQYVVTTNASGVASITFNASGNIAYTIQAQAPYSNNGITVTSSKAYVDFGQPGSLVLSPVSNSFGYSTSSNEAGVVPVTATVIPTVAGASASNIPVTFNFSGVSGSPFISNSAGAYLQPVGSTAVVNTDANGQATIYVNATNAGALTVDASASNLTTSSSSTLTWEQSGVASQIKNTPTGTVSANVNTNVTISGTVEDSMGNPVANTQVLVSGSDANNTGDFVYVNGSTQTAFPNVGNSIAGADASTSFGDIVTTDANGVFSITVTDTKAEAQTATLNVWALQNGQIVGAGGTGTLPLNTYNLSFEQSNTTLNALYVDTSTSGLANGTPLAANNEYTTLTGLGYQEGGSATQAAVYASGFAGTTPYTPASGTVQYTIGGNNKGFIAAVDGVALNGTAGLPNDPSSAVVNVTYNGSGAVSGVTVDGTAISIANAPAFGLTFVPGDKNVENDTFTVTTGSQSATVGANFTAGQPAELGNAGSFTVSPGQSQTVTFTVEDSNGNAIPYGTVKLLPPAGTGTPASNGIDNLWVTAVNGQQLAQTVYNGTTSYGTQPTPVPLFDGATNLQSSVYLSGAISASNIGTNVGTVGTGNQAVTLYADQNGKVAVTFTAGGNGVWNTSTDTVDGATASGTGNTIYFAYDSNGNIVLTTDASAANIVGSLSY